MYFSKFSFSTIQYNTTVKLLLCATLKKSGFSTIQYNTTVKHHYT